MENVVSIRPQNFMARMKSSLKADFRRMLTTPLIYIMLGICFAIPVLTLVMTTLNGGQDGAGFTSVWQAVSTLGGTQAAMDMTSMLNMNMAYFAIGIFVCLFVGNEFKSGYAKNLFTVRSKKTDYIASKTVVGIVGGIILLLGFFVGAMIGGGVSGLSFAMSGFGAGELVCCILSKLFISAIFVAIPIAMSVLAKDKLWLSVLLTLGASMLLFTMIPMITPLNSGVINVILTLVGGAIFAFGIGAASNIILNKTNIV